MHPPLILIFCFACFFCFIMAISLTRVSADQKAVNKRLGAVKASQGAVSSGQGDSQQLLKTLEQGRFDWLEQLVDSTRLHRQIQLLLIQADRKTSVGNVLMTSFALALSAGMAACFFTSSIWFGAVIGAALAYVPFGILQFQRSRRIAAFNKALPDCIDLMARSLRAGHAVMAALNIVAAEALEPAKTEFSEVCKKQNYGLPMRDAFLQLLDRVPSQDLKVLVTGMLVQKDTGGNLAEILDRILFVVRERLRLQGEIKTHTAQGRLTGWILCLLPVVMIVLLNLINPGYSKILFTDPTGRKLLYAGIALLCIGGLLIRKIVSEIEA